MEKIRFRDYQQVLTEASNKAISLEVAEREMLLALDSIPPAQGDRRDRIHVALEYITTEKIEAHKRWSKLDNFARDGFIEIQ